MAKDYYKILGVNPGAGPEEIKKAFFALAKKYHPDKHRDADDGDYAVKFAEINEAYKVLKNGRSKTEYDRSFQTVGTRREKTAKERYKADELYKAAQKAIKINDVNSAIDLLKAAVRMEPDRAEFYSLLGLTLSEKPRRLHEAREHCEKAVEIEPYDVRNYINLGLVYKKAGLKIRAQKQFEKVLQWEPENPTARKELGLSKERGVLERIKRSLGRLKKGR
ncbi:MAG: DnaJ domain-containing protein [Deltaproteobacteria bacterium]|nr:DnaJ domain-containing protein [Deltaproteobacteria bacterium]